MLFYICKVYFTLCVKVSIISCSKYLFRKSMFIGKGGDKLKNKIENIRKEKNIRQEDFAKAMGVSRQTISSLENGRYNPSILLAYKIAKYFDMTIEEVFLFEEEDFA